MNVLLLEPEDLMGPDVALVKGRRLAHAQEVLKSQGGSRLRVGLLGGLLGVAEVVSIHAEGMALRLHMEEAPPPKLPLTLLLALPRPKVLNRVLASAVSLGVARLILLNAWKVEKAYWKSPKMEPANLRAQMILGLEQARDTQLPEFGIERLFKPFVEDRLSQLRQGCRGLVADPSGALGCPRELDQPTLLAIGPEGGWIPAELQSWEAAGFQRVSLGPRILRTETALAALIGRMA